MMATSAVFAWMMLAYAVGVITGFAIAELLKPIPDDAEGEEHRG